MEEFMEDSKATTKQRSNYDVINYYCRVKCRFESFENSLNEQVCSNFCLVFFHLSPLYTETFCYVDFLRKRVTFAIYRKKTE